MRYRCLNEETNCPTFECDYVPYECPNCGYTCTERVDDNDGGNLDDSVADNLDDSVADNRNDAGACKSNNFKEWLLNNKKFIIAILIALAMVLIGFVLYYYFNQSIKIDMKYDESKCQLSFTIKENVIAKNIEDYKIEVWCDNKIFDTILFGEDSHAYYGDERMIDGKWYDFYLKLIDGDDIEKMLWPEKNVDTKKYKLEVEEDKFGRFYLKGDGAGPPEQDAVQDTTLAEGLSFKIPISCNTKPIPEKKQHEITVVENGMNMYNYEGLKFECDGIEYNSNPFYIAAPQKEKEIEVKVSANNVSNSPIILQLIIGPIQEKQNLPPALTKEEVQSVIDSVSRGIEKGKDAQNKLAAGSVTLKKTIKEIGISTLWDVLEYASDGYKFKVVSFEIDSNTNKIKSGTLVVDLVE